MDVIESASASEWDDVTDNACPGEATVNTDEWNGYNRAGKRHGRVHRTVDHSGPRCMWAIDADGDGVREIRCNRQEGLWTGLRNLLRPFRGVGKWYLAQYEAIFQWCHNQKHITGGFLRILSGKPQAPNWPHEPIGLCRSQKGRARVTSIDWKDRLQSVQNDMAEPWTD